jgi:NAD(P)-dependent dehydrogenase (short-subunit alcohol dehydrogenase family)
MTRTALVVGASRGLGHAIAAELVDRGWDVVGTVRDASRRTPLHALADTHPDRVRIETFDVTRPEQLAPLRDRLPALDLLLVSAGTTSHQDAPLGEVPTEAFVEVMVTNALAPLRVVEALDGLVGDDGLVAALSSGQGSITNNTTGLREVYRSSKAALNMGFRSRAARCPERAHLLLAPGWIRTDLGGDDAPYTVEESTPLLVDRLESRLGEPGLAYLDRDGAVVPW